MSYEHKIEDAIDAMYEVYGADVHEAAVKELKDVYRKAEAYDEIEKMLNDIRFGGSLFKFHQTVENEVFKVNVQDDSDD